MLTINEKTKLSDFHDLDRLSTKIERKQQRKY